MFDISGARRRAKPPTFGDLLKQEYMGAIRDMMESENRMLFGGPLRRLIIGLPCDYGLLSRLHVWGPIKRVEAHTCYQCDGRLEYSEYDSSGISQCDHCIAGLIPGYAYRSCLRCDAIQSTQR